jgi:uncharacterized protein (TIGR00730 family)
MNSLTNVAVFCGANAGSRPLYLEAACALGSELGRRKLGLVYGGGSVGLMGKVARAVRDQDCHVVGVIPSHLTTKELMGQKIGDLIVVETMHERKATMAKMADAFIAMPGGFGTMDELFEMVTWGQLGLHVKPIGLFNVGSYFDPLLAFIDHAVAEGFILPHYLGLFVVEADPARLLDLLAFHQPPPGLVTYDGMDRA